MNGFASLCLWYWFWMAALLPAGAAQVTLAWNANPETDIAEYTVWYGEDPNSLQSMTEVGLDTTAVIAGLEEGTTYYFAVDATNQAGLTSERSDPITHTVPITPPRVMTYVLEGSDDAQAWREEMTLMIPIDKTKARKFYRMKTVTP